MWPRRVASSSPEEMVHILTFLSALPLARSLPSGEYARELIHPEWPRSVSGRWPIAPLGGTKTLIKHAQTNDRNSFRICTSGTLYWKIHEVLFHFCLFVHNGCRHLAK